MVSRCSRLQLATLSGIFSFQPKDHTYQPPYLDNSLGGTVPGAAIALQRSATTWPSVALEVNSTKFMETVQSGRVVAGDGVPVVSKHRDTLLSLLVGMSVAKGSVEPKLGISYVFATLRQEDLVREDIGHFAFTVGVDVVAHVGRRIDVVPSVRYSFVDRPSDAQYAGLGNHIFRAGIGARVRL
jgi:hypothetical protein